MENIYLSDLCAFLQIQFAFPRDFLIKGISIDTRTLRPGEIFLALQGEQFDGHDYLQVAINKGAVALIVQEDYELATTLPVLRVLDPIKALGQIATGYRQSLKVKIIAVTGSSGKTTTKNMIAELLATKYKVISTYRNFNNQIGLPLSILELTAEHEIAVLELGMNHLGEIATLAQIALPDLAVITNIGSAHLGNLGSRENILKAKLEIMEGLDPEKGFLFLNSDDPFLANLQFPETNLFFAGLQCKRPNCLTVDSLVEKAGGWQFILADQDKRIPLFLPLRGQYNVNNALLAIACALHLGISLEDIKVVLRRFVNESLRYEEYVFKGMTLIKDYYSANPEAMRAALETLQSYQVTGKKIAILGEMAELGRFAAEEHRRLGQFCQGKVDQVFFVGDSWRDFAAGYGPGVLAFPTKETLYVGLKDFFSTVNLGENDVLLIKGSRELKMEEVFSQLKKYLERDYSDLDFVGWPTTAVKLYVDTDAMQDNIKQIQNAVTEDVEIMPIVKANAYSCGPDVVANAFRFCNYLAVADGREAVALRRIFPEKEIMVLYQPDLADLAALVKYDFIVGISYYEFAEKLNAVARQKIRVHLEIDTGSGRLGIFPNEAGAIAQKLKELPNIVVEGLYMHYICADSNHPEDQAYTLKQTETFREAVQAFEGVYGPVKFKHASSSAAIFRQKEAHFNMVRPGCAIYGYYPSPVLRENVELTPVFRLSTKILQIKNVPAGTFISYGRTFQTTRESVIATVAIGYADGLSRLISNRGFFVVNGQKAPIVGRICMDLTMLDLTEIIGPLNVGDEVYVFDNHNVTLEDLALWSETIVYEVLTRIVDKVARVEKM